MPAVGGVDGVARDCGRPYLALSSVARQATFGFAGIDGAIRPLFGQVENPTGCRLRLVQASYNNVDTAESLYGREALERLGNQTVIAPDKLAFDLRPEIEHQTLRVTGILEAQFGYGNYVPVVKLSRAYEADVTIDFKLGVTAERSRPSNGQLIAISMASLMQTTTDDVVNGAVRLYGDLAKEEAELNRHFNVERVRSSEVQSEFLIDASSIRNSHVIARVEDFVVTINQVAFNCEIIDDIT